MQLLASTVGETDIQDRLAAMQALDLVRLDDKSGDYLFKHALVRDALYQSLLSDARTALHAKIAAEIERRSGNRLVEVAKVLAHHYRETHAIYEYKPQQLMCRRRGGAVVIDWGTLQRTKPELLLCLDLHANSAHRVTAPIRTFDAKYALLRRPFACEDRARRAMELVVAQVPLEQCIFAIPRGRLGRPIGILARCLRAGPHASFKAARPIFRGSGRHGEKAAGTPKARQQCCVEVPRRYLKDGAHG
jgi:hypothetical protein